MRARTRALQRKRSEWATEPSHVYSFTQSHTYAEQGEICGCGFTRKQFHYAKTRAHVYEQLLGRTTFHLNLLSLARPGEPQWGKVTRCCSMQRRVNIFQAESSRVTRRSFRRSFSHMCDSVRIANLDRCVGLPSVSQAELFLPGNERFLRKLFFLHRKIRTKNSSCRC